MSDEDMRALRRAAEDAGTPQEALRYVDALFRSVGAAVPEPPSVIEFSGADCAPVAPSGRARIMFDRARQKIVYSINGSAWRSFDDPPTLAEVLSRGNTTNGHDILLSSGDRVREGGQGS